MLTAQLMFEVGGYLLFLYCLLDAFRSGISGAILELCILAIFGVVLEFLTLLSIDTYSYAHFYVMIGTIPITIGLGWAAIIYSILQITQGLAKSPLLLGLLSALFALSIDLGMDPVAFREGFWVWKNPGYWFDVPALNFYSWFVIVFSYTWLRALLLNIGYRLPAVSLISVASSLTFLIASDWLFLKILTEIQTSILVSALILFTLFYFGFNRTKIYMSRQLKLVYFIPISLNGFYFILLLTRDYKTFALIGISLIFIVCQYKLLKVCTRKN